MPRNSDVFTDSVWTRTPRPRAGQPALSREQIVRAAIELLDAEGRDGLSMRRLGSSLGAGATSAYWYVRNKDELLDLALDEVMGEVVVPDPTDVGWRAAAAQLARGLRGMILRHPWISTLFGVRPSIGPNSLRLGDRTVALFTSAGFTGMYTAYASSLLMNHAIGSATVESAWNRAVKSSGRSAPELMESIDDYVPRLAADYPDYLAWYKQNPIDDMGKLQEDTFEFGLDRLLDGLAGWLEARGLPG